MKTLTIVTLALSLGCYTSSIYHENQLFAFVGEKIEVSKCTVQENDPTNSLDSCAKAKYLVLNDYYGRLHTDTIEFLAYNHYGEPGFTTYGLIYITYQAGQFYECKYQFTPLYKTQDGRWAAPYNVEDYEHPYNENTSVRPVPIDYVGEVAVDVSGLDPATIARNFPEPYYHVENGRAVAKYGNYIDDLFHLKKNGVLKARGYF